MLELYYISCACYSNRDMFNKPNRDAFHVVILFLLKKLDKDRVAKDYK